MSTVFELLVIVLPVFLLVATGYGAVRTGLFPDSGINALIGFAMTVAIPLLLFRSIDRLDLAAVFRPQHLAAFFGAATVSFAVAVVGLRRVWGFRPGESVALGFSALFSNSLLLGLPIVERAYGAAAFQAALAIIAFHAVYCYMLGIVVMELSRRDGASLAAALAKSLRSILRNALTLGILAGFIANLSGLALPGPIAETADMLVRAALPIALFALGGVLTRYSFASVGPTPLFVSALSLVLHPALAYLLSAHVFGLPEAFVRAAVVIAAMPPGVNGYLFAALYDRKVGQAASTVLLGTLLSLLTITAWLALLGGAAIG